MGGVQPGDKSILSTAAKCRLIGVLGGEVGGTSISRHVRAAGPIRGDAIAIVIHAPSQVGGVEQRGGAALGGVQLGDKGILSTAAKCRLIGVLGGEVAGNSISRHVRLAGPIRGDAIAIVTIVPPQIGGVEQGVARGAEFGDKGILTTAAVRPLVRVLGGEVGGTSISRHVRLAGPIHGDARTIVPTAPPQVSGVDEGGVATLTGVYLGHKDISATAARRPLVGAPDGEVGGRSASRHVRLAGLIHGDARALVITAPPQVGGVEQGRVNDEGLAGVVFVPHRKAAGAQAVQHELRLYLHPPPVDLLVDVGPGVLQLVPSGQDEQVALFVQAQTSRAPVGQPDLADIRPRIDDKGVLERPHLPDITQVDAGVEVVIDHLFVGGETCLPLRRVFADEVVDFSRRSLHANRLRGVSSHPPHPQNGRVQDHDHLSGGKVDGMSAALGVVADAGVHLPLVDGEVQGQLQVGVERSLFERLAAGIVADGWGLGRLHRRGKTGPRSQPGHQQ